MLSDWTSGDLLLDYASSKVLRLLPQLPQLLGRRIFLIRNYGNVALNESINQSLSDQLITRSALIDEAFRLIESQQILAQKSFLDIVMIILVHPGSNSAKHFCRDQQSVNWSNIMTHLLRQILPNEFTSLYNSH